VVRAVVACGARISGDCDRSVVRAAANAFVAEHSRGADVGRRSFVANSIVSGRSRQMIKAIPTLAARSAPLLARESASGSQPDHHTAADLGTSPRPRP
jgi:hypothetical protein